MAAGFLFAQSLASITPRWRDFLEWTPDSPNIAAYVRNQRIWEIDIACLQLLPTRAPAVLPSGLALGAHRDLGAGLPNLRIRIRAEFAEFKNGPV
jgi:hypothetical protein